jgi:hypothetical protein
LSFPLLPLLDLALPFGTFLLPLLFGIEKLAQKCGTDDLADTAIKRKENCGLDFMLD